MGRYAALNDLANPTPYARQGEARATERGGFLGMLADVLNGAKDYLNGEATAPDELIQQEIARQATKFGDPTTQAVLGQTEARKLRADMKAQDADYAVHGGPYTRSRGDPAEGPSPGFNNTPMSNEELLRFILERGKALPQGPQAPVLNPYQR
jgi:hypothetical protein